MCRVGRTVKPYCTIVTAFNVIQSGRNWYQLTARMRLPSRGGAMVLKVGEGAILRAERVKIFFDPPLFGQWGGGKILLRYS